MVDFQERDTRRGAGDESDGDGATDQDADGGDDDHGHDHEDHDHHAHDVESLGVAVVTVSSTRTREEDPAGDAVERILEDAGHEVVVRDVLRDDYDGIQSALDALVGREDVDAVVTTGGTGVTPDDVTIEAAEPMFDKELPGFGELFRRLSREEIGTRIVATRATAGIVGGVLVCCLPGSENAARLGTGGIVREVAPHLVGLARR